MSPNLARINQARFDVGIQGCAKSASAANCVPRLWV